VAVDYREPEIRLWPEAPPLQYDSPENSMRRIALFLLPLITLFPPAASALTVRDVIELTRSGLGEDILLALVEVDPSVFPIDTQTLKRLKEAGVSQRVIVAMIRSGRTQPPLSAEPGMPAVMEEAMTPEPQVIVIDHHDSPQVREVPVAVPVYVPIPVSNRRVHIDNRARDVPDPVDAAHRPVVRSDDIQDTYNRRGQSQPVYWGFGGQLRPDAWQPSPAPKKDRDKDR
jgi:hypothetical protein